MRAFSLAVVMVASSVMAQPTTTSVDTPDSRGWTPLMNAAEMGNVDEIKALLAKGANLEVSSPDVYNGATPLLIAMEFGQHDAAVLLLDRRASIAGARGVGVLERAAAYGFDDILDRMLAAKISPKGTSALSLAAKYGKVSALRKLLAAGAPVDAINKDDHDYSAFIVACQNRQVEAARVLLDAGANINIVDSDGTPAIHWAVFAERPDELHEYAELGQPHDTFWRPHATAPLVQLLIDRKVKLAVVDKDGNTPLHQAALMDAAAAAKLLLAAKVSRTAKNKDGKTAYALAKERNNSVLPLLGPGARGGRAGVARKNL